MTYKLLITSELISSTGVSVSTVIAEFETLSERQTATASLDQRIRQAELDNKSLEAKLFLSYILL